MSFGPCEWSVPAGPKLTADKLSVTSLRPCGEPAMCRMVIYRDYAGRDMYLLNLCAAHEPEARRLNLMIQRSP